MNKIEIEAKVAEELGMPQAEVKKVFSSILSTMTESFSEGETVRIVNFGVFHVADRPTRMGRSPSDGSPVEIPARKRVSFKPGKGLKEVLFS